ncbi:E3 SUMO-protein ligase ZBED1-like isoform X1 [Simochromis diagramma]|uniref:E3 SUMO-protein ligase ZBED1-like isoform X1 n=2 Tax=Simochromis diagramma TaxID=43689 RepID=UPI001A7E9098|nr:E3 SUMO-protein ligase ZBED1-like isoform X1 [Simochromis diagramma]
MITDDDDGSSTRSSLDTPFILAKKAKMTKEKVDEIHRAVTKFIVKDLHPFSTVESPSFREMSSALNPRYQPPSRDDLSNTLIPAWYCVEKSNLIQNLAQVNKVAITCDGWTSIAQDHFLTVTVHYIYKGKMKQNVLSTEAVYESQTGPVVAKEISSVVEQFHLGGKIIAATVDNACNMDVALKKLDFLKVGCFAHTLNLAAQKVYDIPAVSSWCAKIRSVVVWLKRSSLSKTVLREKQRILNLPEHNVILDVKTRWNSLFLMVERFMEQFDAIQAAALDQRLRKPMEKDKLERFTHTDLIKAEEFIKCMQVLYTSTMCVSSDKSPTCSQIIPILAKLEAHFSRCDEDSVFTSSIKEKVWGSLQKRYQDENLQKFLKEATMMDPRFKGRLDGEAATDIWDRLEKAAVANATVAVAQPPTEDPKAHSEVDDADMDKPEKYLSKVQKSPLEKLFEDEDRELQQAASQAGRVPSVTEQVHKELQIYKRLPGITSGQDPVAWWWSKRDTLPNLSALSEKYLCVPASSTPSERVFSCAGHAISQERCRIAPEKANMIIFLQKNC